MNEFYEKAQNNTYQPKPKHQVSEKNTPLNNPFKRDTPLSVPKKASPIYPMNYSRVKVLSPQNFTVKKELTPWNKNENVSFPKYFENHEKDVMRKSGFSNSSFLK